MDEAMKELLEECEEILLEVQILGEDFPKIKEMYENVLLLTKKLELSAQDHISALDSRAAEIKKDIKQQEKETEKAEQLLKEVTKQMGKVDFILGRLENVNEEQQKVSKALIDNIRRVQELSGQYKKSIANPSVPDTSKLKFDYFEKEISGLKKAIKELNNSSSSLSTGLMLSDVYQAKINKLEKEISELRKLVKESSKIHLNVSTKMTTSEIKKAHKIPSNAKSLTLDEEPNCSYHKPYGVWIDGTYLEASIWRDLNEVFATYCFDHYDRINEVVDITEAGFEDDYNYYFIKGKVNDSKYRYLSKYKISIYMPGANDTIRIMQDLCHYYNIEKSEVRVFFYK